MKCLPYDSAMQEVVRPCFSAPFLKEETEVGKKEGAKKSLRGSKVYREGEIEDEMREGGWRGPFLTAL